jgi:hypothetical protein
MTIEITHKRYYKPLKISSAELVIEIAKKKQDPGNDPFIDTFHSWVAYCRENGDDVSEFEEELLELEKLETMAILEQKIRWAEEDLSQAHICWMPEIEELFNKALKMGCDVDDLDRRRLPELRKAEALPGLEAQFLKAENYIGTSGPISWLKEAIENARLYGYDVSDYENRRLPEIKKAQAIYSVELKISCLNSFGSTLNPITDYSDWKKEIIDLEQSIVEAEDFGHDMTDCRNVQIPALRKKISMNEVRKALWKQRFYPEKAAYLPQNIARLIDDAEKEGNDVTSARESLREIMR